MFNQYLCFMFIIVKTMVSSTEPDYKYKELNSNFNNGTCNHENSWLQHGFF